MSAAHAGGGGQQAVSAGMHSYGINPMGTVIFFSFFNNFVPFHYLAALIFFF
jgi:hypothetical protein